MIPATNEQLDGLFARFEVLGPRHFARSDALWLAQVIEHDARCCARLPASFARKRARTRYRKTLSKSWLSEDYFVVMDLRARFRAAAGRLRRHTTPAVALVLYATWVEHTVNAILIACARMHPTSADHIDRVAERIAAKDFDSRLSTVWTYYRAPSLDRRVRKELGKLMKLRNEIVHYKWIGFKPPELHAKQEAIRIFVGLAPELVKVLTTLEHSVSTYMFRPQIRRLLGLSERDTMGRPAN